MRWQIKSDWLIENEEGMWQNQAMDMGVAFLGDSIYIDG